MTKTHHAHVYPKDLQWLKRLSSANSTIAEAFHKAVVALFFQNMNEEKSRKFLLIRYEGCNLSYVTEHDSFEEIEKELSSGREPVRQYKVAVLIPEEKLPPWSA